MVRYFARHEARASLDHRRTTDARVLAPLESSDDRTAASPREESRMSVELPSRQEVEELLYREAALLDEWRLEEWLEPLTHDAVYQMPPRDLAEGDSRKTPFIIADAPVRIR